MKVHNNSKRAYQHNEYTILAGATLEVPADIAKIWISTGDIVEYISPEEAKAKEEALKKENEELKAKLEKAEAKANVKRKK